MTVILIAFALACETNGSAPDAGDPLPSSCTALDASVCTSPPPSFSADVMPIVNRACNATCHAPGVGPWPFTSYDDVHDWETIIQGDIIRCSMPPADAAAANGVLTDSERATILDWMACGAPNN